MADAVRIEALKLKPSSRHPILHVLFQHIMRIIRLGQGDLSFRSRAWYRPSFWRCYRIDLLQPSSPNPECTCLGHAEESGIAIAPCTPIGHEES